MIGGLRINFSKRMIKYKQYLFFLQLRDRIAVVEADNAALQDKIDELK